MKGILLLILAIYFTNDIWCQDTTFNTNAYREKGIAIAITNILSGNYQSNPANFIIAPLSVKNETLQREYSHDKPDESVKAKKFYIKLYGSYGFLTPGSYSVQSANHITYYDKKGDQHDTTIQSQGRKGIGGGSRIGGGIGYVVNDFLNLGIDAEYLMGTKLANTLSSSSDSGYFYSFSSDKMSYHAITLSPYIIFKALAKPRYFIYNKLGILFTLPYTLNTSGSSVSSWTYNWNPAMMDSSFKSSSIKNSTYTGEYKISLGVGFNVAFGANFRINNNWRAFGELFANFSALSASSSRIVTTNSQLDSSYQNNQLSLDPQTEYSTTNTIYQREGLTTNQLVNDLQVQGIRTLTYAAQDKKFTINMNIIGINAGIIYRF